MPLTIKILVTGLAALVPTGNGEVTVVLPAVSNPEHHAFLGYSQDQWTFKTTAGIVPLTGDGFKWIKLDGIEVRLKNARTRPTNDHPRRGWLQLVMGNPLPDPDKCEIGEPCAELQAIDWIPQMAKVAHRFAPIDPTCLERNEYGLIQARAVFEFTTYQTCRLAGGYDRDRKVVQVQAYDFKLPDGAAEAPPAGQRSPPRRQALAAGALYEVQTLHTQETCGKIRVSLEKIATDQEVAALTSRGDCTEDLEFALLNLLDDDAEDHSEHFRTYFALADRPPFAAEPLPHPMEVPNRQVEVTNEVMKDSCRSSFFLDGESVPLSGIPPGTKLATPDEYEAAGPPLCTPMRMEKPD